MENKKASVKQMGIALLLIVILTIIDQISKLWAVNTLKDQPAIVWIPNVFELQYVENRGAAFGLFQNQQWFFLIIVLLVGAAAVFFFLRMPDSRRFLPLRTICVLIMAGAIGNAIDRVLRGFVVDFFSFSLINFPVFNVADIYITVSMVCLLFMILFYYKEDELQFFDLKHTKKEKGN